MKCRVSAFMEDFTSLNVTNLQNWFTDESTIWIPPAAPITGKSRILALFRAIYNRYEKIEWTVVEILKVDDNRYFYVCDSVGNMKGNPEYKNRVCTDITFNEDGKIIKLSDYFKDTAVFVKK